MMRSLAALLFLCLAVAIGHAALPTFWQVSTEAEFLQGEVENLSIDSYGRLTLGPAVAPVYESSAPFLWTLVGAPDGSFFIGSGNEGQVLRVDAMGRSSVFFDAEELEVHAIALIPGGGIYAATSPDGRIYKIDAKGSSSVFFDPPDKYIWSLLIDAAGNVFAGTGDRGVIYKITPDGKGTPFYSTKATHVMALAQDGQRRLLAGTESPGRVFQIDATGKPFVLLDSPYNEIRTIRVDPKGNIYVAAVTGRGAQGPDRPPAPAPEPPPAPPVASVSTEVVSITIAADAASATQSTPSTPAPAPRGTQSLGTGGVYRITPDGASDLVWQLREDAPYDMAFETDGSVLVATGNEGKLYRLTGDPMQSALVARATVQQITALLPDPSGRVLFATSNPGKVLRLAAQRADSGTYVSDVRDAQSVATWGAIKWQATAPAGTRVEVSTRSGNTRTADETWSDWSTAYGDPNGSPITSPRARYLQWRAVLTANRDEAPILTSVTAAYLPRNGRPRVTSITIHPPGTVFQRPFPTGEPEIAGFEGETPDRRAATQNAAAVGAGGGGGPTLGRRTYQKGLLTFVWRGEDENRDELSYDVLYRREGETSWKPLRRALRDAIFVWDTTSVPNGRYVVQVVASDLPSNAPDNALAGSMESSTFEVDNTPPVITVTNVGRDAGRVTIAFDVRDADSSVQKVEYSLDGDRWQAIYPKDGIADSRAEQFELRLNGEPAARAVIIRATDALNNVTSARGEGQPLPAPPARR